MKIAYPSYVHRSHRHWLALLISCALVACGGGGGGGDDGATQSSGGTGINQPAPQTPSIPNNTWSGQTPGTGNTGGAPSPSNPPASGGGTPSQPSTPAPSEPSTMPFSITRVDAPTNGAIICRNVTLAVSGVGLRNVELVPEGSFFPKFGTFNVSADGTVATFTFNPMNHLVDRQLRVRIVAWDAPAGQPGRSIVAMEARTWYPFYEAKATCPTEPPTELPRVEPPPTEEFTVSAVEHAPANGERVCGTQLIYIRGTNIRNAELVAANDYFPKYGTFDVDSSGTFGRLYFNPANVPPGQLSVRILAWNAPAGQSGQEIVAMAPRTWEIAPGAPPCEQ